MADALPEVIDITVCISPCSGTVQEALLQLPAGSTVQQALDAYRTETGEIETQIRSLLHDLPEEWKAYAARSTAVFESMHDKMYHEYTVAFPAEGQIPTDYYIYRLIEKKRVLMFLEQPRIESLDELLMEVGFHGEWIDLVNVRLQEMQAMK